MKKVLFIVSFAGMLGFSACKEIGPDINFGRSKAVDTVYTLSTPETVQPHNVLVEDFTGASCPNCPSGHDILTNLITQYGSDRIVVMALHLQGNPQCKPPNGAAYDFRDSTATRISDVIYGSVSQLPNAGIDRSPYNNSIQIDRAYWPTVVAARNAVATPVNLTLKSGFNSSGGVSGAGLDTILVHVSYTQAISDTPRLSIAIVEDGITDFQEYPIGGFPPSDVDSFYSFNDVMRDMVTPYAGETILDTIPQKQPGLTLDRAYIYDFSGALRRHSSCIPAHCRVVAFIQNGSGSIMQAATVKITGP